MATDRREVGLAGKGRGLQLCIETEQGGSRGHG